MIRWSQPLVTARIIPEAMNLVLDKLLAKEAVDRYQTFRDVRQDVRPAADGTHRGALQQPWARLRVVETAGGRQASALRRERL